MGAKPKSLEAVLYNCRALGVIDPDMTIAVYWDVKHKQNKQVIGFVTVLLCFRVYLSKSLSSSVSS